MQSRGNSTRRLYDGRINPSQALGGNAIYCVDATMQPAADWLNGGIRVPGADGAEELFVSSARVADVGIPADNTLLGADSGVALFRLATCQPLVQRAQTV